MEILAYASPDFLFHWLPSTADTMLVVVSLVLISRLMPGRFRSVVFSNGVGNQMIRFWQRRNAKLDLAKKDQQDNELRQRLSELDGDVESLQLENQRLKSKRQELMQQQQILEREIATLSSCSHRQSLMQALIQKQTRLQQENIENSAQQQRVSAALERWHNWQEREETPATARARRLSP